MMLFHRAQISLPAPPPQTSIEDWQTLYIECNPSTSIPFWQRMGFTLIKSDSERNYAFRIMDKPLELPADGNDVAVVIRFFPESKKWEAATKPYVVHSSRARVTPDGVVHLAERVQFHEEAFPNVRDVVVEIAVEGSYRFCDKAKYNSDRMLLDQFGLCCTTDAVTMEGTRTIMVMV